MDKVRSRLKISAGAIGAALMLVAPANMASANDYSTPRSVTAASLAGVPSRLAMITAAQSGGSAPMAAPAPAKITEAVAETPAAKPVMLASIDTPRADTSIKARLQPAVLTDPQPVRRARTSNGAPNLFGTKAIRVSSTRLDAQWRRVNRTAYSAPSGLSRVAYVDRDEQIRQVNAWVNHAIAFSDDVRTYGERDHWATAEESLRRGQGDCEDYAIAKMEILRAAGVPASDLNLMIVRDLVRRQDHAILAVRTDSGFVILDSGTDRVLRAENVRDYRPIMTFNSQGAWIHGYAEPEPKIELASAGDALAGSN